MGNINSVIDFSYYDSFAAELNGKFQRLRHLVNNNQPSGDYHEEILRVVLRNFLTKRYSVKTGFIFKDDENCSNQMDIIIVDENSPAAYVFQEGDFAVVMPEAVVGFIEVKTTLRVGDYDLGLNNIASAKRLFEFPINHPGILFGYQSSTNSDSKISDSRVDNWLKREPAKKVAGEGDVLQPDAIMWLNDNYSLLRYNVETNKINDGFEYRSFHSPEGKVGWQLSVLLAIIIGGCENGEFHRTHTFGQNLANRLLSTGAMDVSDNGFILGKGKI